MVEEVLDEWYGPDDSFFKFRADDGNLYIIRHAFQQLNRTGGWNRFGRSRSSMLQATTPCTNIL